VFARSNAIALQHGTRKSCLVDKIVAMADFAWVEFSEAVEFTAWRAVKLARCRHEMHR
jgi:hypothetical protein